ncbi:hypothetical protein ACP5WL_30040 [Enterocloster bolteae]|uniref:hypothetical protein n=1 Tax=Lachnospiraceae TaxID=186803 RepID=UPI000E44F73F|nr:hypothetical protein [Hungatella hathewayi]RGO62101.1 hypothetical protein DXB08_34315 [Hungatella hathewayi]
MEATVLLRHEVKSVDDYYETPSPVFRYNSFSNLQQTAICGEVKKVNKMKNLSFVNLDNLDL